MTHAEAVALKASIETALLNTSNNGVIQVTSNGESITYGTKQEAMGVIAELNRSIQAYNRRLAGQNPHWKSPICR